MSIEHDDVRDLLAPAALGAATPAEQIRVETHAGGCAVCREELERLRLTADTLALAVPQLEPPPRLRESVLAAVREELESRPASVRPARRRRRSWWSGLPALMRPRPLLAGLAAAATLVVLGWNIALQTRADPPDEVTAAVVQGQGSARQVRAHLIYLPGRDAAVIRFSRLAPLDSGTGYELWAVRPEGPVSIGFVNTSISSPGEGVIAASDLAGVEALALTPEPLTNRAAPTGEKLVVVPLPESV